MTPRARADIAWHQSFHSDLTSVLFDSTSFDTFVHGIKNPTFSIIKLYAV